MFLKVITYRIIRNIMEKTVILVKSSTEFFWAELAKKIPQV